MRVRTIVAALVCVGGVVFGDPAVPMTHGDEGFRRQCDRPQWVCYRSFNKELERTGQFGEMGITNRCFFAANTINHGGKPYCEYPVIWKGFGEYDFTPLDSQIQDLICASPNARFVCMVDLNTPYWATHKFWLDSFTDITHAVCDPKWMQRTTEWMTAFLGYAESKWGDRIGAYVLSGGGTSEWYEYDRGRTSRNKDVVWESWCKARGLEYGETVPPQTALRRAAFENLVYDPATEEEKIAYWKFHNSLPADALLAFAKTARKLVSRDKEIGAFFGYCLVSDARIVSFGHLDYQRVFASPDIDFFIAPGNYSDRAMGGGSGSQLVDGTLLRYGKRFLHEIDFGPHDQKRWGPGVWQTIEDDIAGNTREAAFAMARNANYWWFDMWGGFYRNSKVRDRIAQLKKVQDRVPPAQSRSEVLLVVDPSSLYYVNENHPLSLGFGERFRNQLARTGAPYDTCSFEDLATIDLSRYKLICLNSTLLITPEREQMLKDRVLTSGRTVLWCYAPGLLDGKSLDAARVKKLAGVDFKTLGISRCKHDNGWQSFYAYDYRLLTAEKLAEIEEDAGVHRYVQETVPVFAKENFLAIHVATGGVKTVFFPSSVTSVYDLLTGDCVSVNDGRADILFSSPDTKLFSLGRQSHFRIDVSPGLSFENVKKRIRSLSPMERSRGVEVVLGDGDYILTEPLTFDHRDGAVGNGASVVWRARNKGQARLIGGRRIPASMFRPVTDDALLSRLPAEARGKVYVANVSSLLPNVITDLPEGEFQGLKPPCLFVNHDFGVLARWPNDRWASFISQIEFGRRAVGERDDARPGGAFVFNDSHVLHWNFADGVWLNGYWTHDWYLNAIKAKGIETDCGSNIVLRLARLMKYGVKSVKSWGARAERRFYAFNIFDEIDSPREWYLDRQRKLLYLYQTREGGFSDDDEIVLAVSEKSMLNVRGAHDLHFSGLSFEYSFGTSISFEKCTGCSISNCLFACVGGTGISVDGTRNRVHGCEVAKIGGVGINVAGGDRRRLIRADNIVENCRIHDYGRIVRTYAPGLHVTGVGQILRNNEIYDAPHQAIGYCDNEHLFESNEIHHVLLETADSGAVYTGRDWTSQGNVLRYNYIHELGGAAAEQSGVGMYFDDCDCGDAVYSNVFWKVARGVLIGGGRDHPIVGNVFVDCPIGISMDIRGMRWKQWNMPGNGWNLEEKAQKVGYRTEPWKSRYPHLANIMNDSPREPLYNPILGNVFINCYKNAFLFDSDKKADDIASKMECRDNRVYWTSAGLLPEMDLRFTDGFRVQTGGNTNALAEQVLHVKQSWIIKDLIGESFRNIRHD